jgi:hypothetical protein
VSIKASVFIATSLDGFIARSSVPLFGPLNHDVRLTHIATRQFENGFVQSNYRVADTV